jgi:iron complex transport system substrate-binding protein
MIDVRQHRLRGDEAPFSYRLPASAFLYTTIGHAHVYLDGRFYDARPFHVLHSGKGSRVEIYCLDDAVVFYLILYQAKVFLPWRKELRVLLETANPFARTYEVKPKAPLELLDLLVAMYEEWQSSTPLQRFHVKTLFQLWVHQILQQLQEQDGKTGALSVVEQAILYIQDKYAEPLSVETISQRFGYSAKHLSKLFKKQTGHSLMEFVIQVRMEQAKAFLLHSDATVQEIAEKVGYADRYYYSRLFAKYVGMSPIRFKKQGEALGTEICPYALRRSSIVPLSVRRYIDSGYENHYRYKGRNETSMNSRKLSIVATMLVCFALVLSACGAGTGGGAGAASGNPQAVAVKEQSAASADSQKQVRIMKTIKGEIEIPSAPKRVIVDLYLGSFIALQFKPIGTPELNLKNPYFAESLVGVENIGDYENISLEKMLELQPDLIFTGNKAAFEQYQKIAPTVVVPFGQLKNVHEEITFVGQLLGKEAEAKAWLTEYDQRIAQAREKIAKVVPADATVSIMQDWGKQTGVFGDNFGRGGQAVYGGLGLKPPAAIAKEIMEKQEVEVSSERLPTYAGDYIILTSEERTMADLKADPIWRTLDAVKNDRVYIWKKAKSWYFDPIATLSQTEELADWLVSTGAKK